MLVGPEGFYQPLAGLIEGARQSIDLVVYTLEHPELAQKLAEAAQRRVRVRLLVEGSPAGGVSDLEKWSLATIAAAGLAAAEIWRRRTGRAQAVTVDMRHAAVEFRSERHMRIDGGPPGPTWDKIAGVYDTGDGRKVRLHTNFPHHRDGMLALLESRSQELEQRYAGLSQTVSALENEAELRAVEQALQQAYDRGAAVEELMPLWQQRNDVLTSLIALAADGAQLTRI